ncbi:MAG: hypothetical protein [Bacteriophage sp.]|jgi:hypothetical protein|nr:MAG: hypothetical protein [Bacteriophage sp.]UVX32824.1 MAG: hypothetical protein [Bacteriophage sp.]UVY03399.1 MAG: hypothetical protein [Bacteriophage sp.]
MKKLKSIELYRNFPVIDQKQNSNFILKLFPFFFQKLKKTMWIEIPFVGVKIVIN